MASSSSEEGASTPGASTTQDGTSKSEASEPAVTSRQFEHVQKGSFLRRIWGIFSAFGFLFSSSSDDDFEKKLQHLSKEEAAAHTRLKGRTQTWRRLARGIIIYSIVIELLLLGIAVIMTRAPELSWQMRALRVSPAFAFPALASLLYSTCSSYFRMCERKDQKLLDRVRNERKAKIDELKERTNYYLTQQLIHKYDSDPAAKEAAARVLASKLGADAGLALALEQSGLTDASKHVSMEGRRQNAEPLDATGLRRRTSTGHHIPAGQAVNGAGPGLGGLDSSDPGLELEQATSKVNVGGGGGGWLARLAAMLVGEDPTQCYALICKNCHMHNGLARKEDFQYIAYYCPHCQSLNGSRQLGETASNGSGSRPMTPPPTAGAVQALNTGDVPAANAQLAAAVAGMEAEVSENLSTASENLSMASEGSDHTSG